MPSSACGDDGPRASNMNGSLTIDAPPLNTISQMPANPGSSPTLPATKKLHVTIDIQGTSSSGESSRSTKPGVTHLAKPTPNLQLPPTSARRGSLQPPALIALWKSRSIKKWKAPVVMVSFLLLGLALSIAHCIVYSSLNGNIVGSSANQEENLRYCFGSFLVLQRRT